MLATKKRAGGATPRLGNTIAWCKEDKDTYAGGLLAPQYVGDAGYDICASQDVWVLPDAFARIPTNIRVCIPDGYWAMLVGRSSTFFKRQLLVQTAIIDNGYRGSIWCVVRNMSKEAVTIRRKERVMQLIIFPLNIFPVVEALDLPPSERGEKGFGSTGILEEQS